MDQKTHRKPTTLAELDAELQAMHLEGHWHNRQGPPPPAHPVAAQPHLWRWRELQARLEEASALVGVDRGASRRTLRLCAPGLPIKAATHSIHASLQIVTPGEVARAHRHSNNAFRFIIQGSPQAYTTVEGERFTLSRHDLILTPPWTWHDHANEGTEPVYWIDGHDLPLMRSLSTEFFEGYALEQQVESRPSGYWDKVARANPRPDLPDHIDSIPYLYSGAERLASLRALGPAAHDPTEGILLDYANPLTGGPTMPTIACRLHRLLAQEVTRRRRHTASTIYHVVAGQGATVAGSTRLDWREGDLFTVPNWTWYRHEVGSGEAILFSASDDPLFKAIGQYRNEIEPDGQTRPHQQRVFTGADR